MKKNILITGGFGYLGTCLVNYLLDKNYQVVVIDNLVNGVKLLKKNLFFYHEDYSSSKVPKIIKYHRISDVIHLAAFIDSEESMFNPKKYFHNNVQNLIIFLENIKNLKIRNFIFASSASVYGNSNKHKIKETSAVDPVSIYGLTKLQGENIITFYAKKYNFKAYILRFFNLVGADPSINCGPLNKSYKHIFNSLLKYKKFIINGTDYKTPDKTCLRDYISIFDIAAIIHKILKKNLHMSNHLVLNCGSGNGYSVKEVAYSFKKMVNPNISISSGPRRRGDSASIIADISKIKKLLNFRPKYSKLTVVLKNYYDWRSAKLK